MSDIKVKQEMARTLIANGYSYRQVAKFLHWKGVGSVQIAMRSTN